MPNELSYQRKFIQVIKDHGGYAKKWSSTFAVGVPDLIVVFEGLTCFVEMKLEKGWNKNTKRTIDVTPIQESELKGIVYRGGGIAVVALVVEKGYNDSAIALLAIQKPNDSGVFQVERDEVLQHSVDWKDFKKDPRTVMKSIAHCYLKDTIVKT